MERAIADIYARGMYAAARDAGKTDEVREELLGLRDILRAEKLFRRFLQDPAISRDEKKEKIHTIFDGKVTDETRFRKSRSSTSPSTMRSTRWRKA